MTHAEKIIGQLIIQKERKIYNQIRDADNIRKKVMLLNLIRYIDSVSLQGISQSGKDEKSDLKIYLSILGANKVFQMFIGDYVYEGKCPLSPISSSQYKWANSIFYVLGSLNYLKRAAILSRAGLTNLSYNEDNKQLFIDYGENIQEFEGLDREHEKWFDSVVNNNIKNFEMEKLKKEFLPIKESLRRNVNPWKKYYIQYNSTPSIDYYYEKYCEISSLNMLGYDNFPHDAVFGGIEYSLYSIIARNLIGISKKHLDFCIELKNKDDSINLLNIITITCDIDEIVSSFSRFFRLSKKQVKKIIDCFILDTENVNYHCREMGGIPPPYIRISSTQVVRSLSGTLFNPYSFLNKELRRRYPRDYSRAINRKENIFREELYSLFQGSRYKRVNQPIKIKNGKEISTDIDAIIFDSFSKSLALFQLKWQEPFGSDLRERYSRQTNFLPNVEKWISKVNRWLDSNDKKKILIAFRILDENDYDNIYLFVINRYVAHFSGTVYPSDTAISNWHHFFHIWSDIPKNLNNPLGIIYNSIIQDQNSYPPIKEKERITFKIGDYNVAQRLN